MKISVVVPTYRRRDCLARCLASLASQERAPDEVIVVGQGEDREPGRIVLAGARDCNSGTVWLYVHRNEPNMVAAYNAGLGLASGDIVAFIDDDAAAMPDWLKLIEKWYEDPRVGAVGGPNIDYFNGRANPTYAKKVGRVTWYGRYIANHGCLTDGPQRVHFLRGCNMSFRRAALTPFPNELRPYWSANEIFVCGAARRKRYELIYDPAIRVDHFPEPRWRLDRYDNYGYASEGEGRRYFVRNDAYNFVYAMLAYLPVKQKLIFMAYDFLVGNRRTPGVLRAALLVAEGRRSEAADKFGPSLLGKWEGVCTYVKTLARFRAKHFDAT